MHGYDGDTAYERSHTTTSRHEVSVLRRPDVADPGDRGGVRIRRNPLALFHRVGVELVNGEGAPRGCQGSTRARGRTRNYRRAAECGGLGSGCGSGGGWLRVRRGGQKNRPEFARGGWRSIVLRLVGQRVALPTSLDCRKEVAQLRAVPAVELSALSGTVLLAPEQARALPAINNVTIPAAILSNRLDMDHLLSSNTGHSAPQA